MAISIHDYDFEYPESLVAQRALERGASRILHCPLNGQSRQEYKASDIVELFRPGDCLVVNNTKVIPARLHGKKPGGGACEILLVQPHGGDPTLWEAMVRPGKAFTPQKKVHVDGVEVQVEAVLEDGIRVLRFDCSPDEFPELLKRAGEMPLPPYIKRKADASDAERYQTVFAKKEGAVAAPTASLHFSLEMLEGLRQKGVEIVEVTLHVGPGTFKPVEVDDATQHPMHSERFEISKAAADTIMACKSAGGRVIAVGTTAVRVLETSADSEGRLHEGQGETSIYIFPGYQWKIVDGLLTNFHWPKSTLLLLVSSFYGKEQTLNAYREAIQDGFRLFSYGDGMLIL
jgi:S-adenosylmethionine:tRNA ribosyltransferase-isomerase